MKFLNNLVFTKLQLIDAALVIALLPVVVIVDLPMIVFLLCSIVFIYKKMNSQIAVVIFGLLCLVLSALFFSIENLGSLSWFVELIISLLLIGIILQRLNEKINFYLVISPFLLLVLSLFFNNTITSLFFTIFQLFCFSVLYLLYFMKKPLIDGIRMASVIFFISMPVIIILFLFFPRISFDRGEFGFKEDASAVRGFEGSMSLENDALDVLSDKKVMEIEFLNTFPTKSQLYFRGSVLYERKGNKWIESKVVSYPKSLRQKEQIVRYKVALQPHYKNYIYALDYPVVTIKNSYLTSGYTIVSEKSLVDMTRYEMQSSLKYKSFDETNFDTLTYDKNQNLQTQKMLEKFQDLSQIQKYEKLNEIFMKASLEYTLQPPQFEMQNFVDDFLFSKKRGYCVHFAASYAQAARMLGIPSRIVTGFLGKYENKVENYLVVKQKDAHAWVEVFLKKEGWVRVDPTSYALTNTTPQISQNQKRFESFSLQFNYIKYKIQTWVLNYNHITQRGFFKNLINDTLYLAKFLFFIGALIVLAFIVFIIFKKSRCEDKISCLMQKFLKKLEKRGIVWDKKVSLHRFLLSLDDEQIEEIDMLYLKLKFSNSFSKDGYKRLKAKIDAL